MDDDLNATCAGMIKYLNRLVTPLLNYVDVAVVTDTVVRTSNKKSSLLLPKQSTSAAVIDAGAAAESSDDTMSLSVIIKQLKGSYFMSVKQSVLTSLLKRDADPMMAQGGFGSMNRGQHVSINRLRAMAARETATPAASGSAGGGSRSSETADMMISVFGQLFTALRRAGYSTFRNAQPHQQLLNVQLVGEVCDKRCHVFLVCIISNGVIL